MNELEQFLIKIKEKCPELYRLITQIVDRDIPDEEIQHFISLPKEERKQWVIEQIKLLEEGKNK